MSDRELTPEVIAKLRRLNAQRTPGDWKLWGMQILADQTGSGNVDDAVRVAHTHMRDDHGKPRTFDADLIATVVRYLPQLLDAAEAQS